MIYLDYQATTPVAPEVRETMQPWLEERFANPHSPHAPGRAAAAAVEVARDVVAGALGLRRGRLVFTSGATEAVNWAIQSSLRASPPGRPVAVTIATEHACVLDTVEAMKCEGFEARILPVDGSGLVDLAAARAAIGNDVAIVAAMLVNNEIGTIQPIAALAALAHDAGARFFCDAVQGFGRVDIPAGCDMVAVSAHKVHGPKGIGALWLRDGLDLPPLLHGGGQQFGLRSGTLAPALCAGFGAAARLLVERREEDATLVAALWTAARDALGDGWIVNGSEDRRYFGNLSLRSEGLDVGRLMSDLREVAFSAGSACASGSGRASHVLRAIGLTDAEARSSIRIGFGRYTTVVEIERAVELIGEAVDRQRMWA